MQKRRRFKHPDSLIARLTIRAEELRASAQRALSSSEKTDLLKKADQYDQAARLDGWLGSNELTHPN